MIEFRLLGSLELQGEDDHSVDAVLAQTKRLALLAYLSIARPQGFHRRDKLLSLFWPDADQSRARGSLRSSVHFLRGELGSEVLLNRGDEEVGLDWGRIWCDVSALQNAYQVEAWEDVLSLYRGDLLDGFHISGCPDFEDWLAEERERLRELAASAAWAHAHECLGRGEITEAERTGQRALGLVSTDENEVRRFIWALAGSGDRAAAIRFYERFAERLAEELELDPATETMEVAEAIRAGEGLSDRPAAQVLRPVGDSSIPDGALASDAGIPIPPRKGLPKRRRWTWVVGAFAVTALAIAFQSRFFGFMASPIPVGVLPPSLQAENQREMNAADRIRETLLETLIRNPRVEAIPRVSLLTLRESPPSITEIAQELGADFLLKPTVALRGDSLDIHVLLLDGKVGALVWDRRYTLSLEVGELSAFSDDFGRELSRALSLPPTQGVRVAGSGGFGGEARSLFREAVALQILDGPQVENRRIDLLREAVSLDPGFGEAWAVLARRLIQADPPEWDAEREVALQKAEALAPGSFETLMARASWEMWMEWDFQEGREWLEKAQALRPDDSDLLSWIADAERRLGNWGASIEAHRLLFERAPHSASDLRYAAFTFQMVGDEQTSVELLEQALQLHPTLDQAKFLVLREYQLEGDFERLRVRIEALDQVVPPPTADALWEQFSFYESDYSSRLEWQRRKPGNHEGKGIYCHLVKDLGCQVAYGDSLLARIQESLASRVETLYAYGALGRAQSYRQMAMAYALKGDRAEAIRMLDLASEEFPVSGDALRGPDLHWSRLRVFSILDDQEGVLDALEDCFKAPSRINARVVHAYPTLDFVRDHPRYQALLEKYADGPFLGTG